MSKFTSICAAAAALIVLSSAARAADCKPAFEIKTITPGKLTVAVYNYPPFSMITNDNQASGIDVQMVEDTAKANCLEFVPLNLAPAAVVQSVVSGKADVAVGAWYRSEARSKVVGLSLPTYIDAMVAMSKDGLDSVDAMKGKSVGTVTGYVWNAELQKIFGSDVKSYPDGMAMYQDLETGRLDVALDGSVAPVEAQKGGRLKGMKIMPVQPNPGIGSTTVPPQSALLYTLGNKELGEALDATIATIHKDGTLVKWLKEAGYGANMAETGDPRLVK